jgi:hypothetical protein
LDNRSGAAICALKWRCDLRVNEYTAYHQLGRQLFRRGLWRIPTARRSLG